MPDDVPATHIGQCNENGYSFCDPQFFQHFIYSPATDENVKHFLESNCPDVITKCLCDQPQKRIPEAIVHVAVLRDPKMDIWIPPGEIIGIQAFTDKIPGGKILRDEIVLQMKKGKENRQISDNNK